MKIKLTKRRLLIALTVITACSMILYTACKKQFNPNITSNSFIGKAQRFMSDAVKKEREMLEKPDSILGLYTRRFARMEKLSALLNWDEAREYSQDGLHFVITMVNENRKPFKNQNFEAGRSIIFYLDNSGRMKMRIMEIMSKKGGTLGSDLQQIVRIAFINEQRNRNNGMEGINATVICYNENYTLESSFQMASGSWTATKAEFKNTATVKKRPLNTRNQRITCQTCTHWYLVGYWYDIHTYEVVDYEVLNEWDECTENGSPASPEYGPEPSSPLRPESCDEAEILNIVADPLESFESVCENLEVITTMPETMTPAGTIRREKDYPWDFARCNLSSYSWHFTSYEHGVHIKLGDTWYWESLTHTNISPMIGSAPGEVTCTIDHATPSFYAANLMAQMTLDWSTTLKIVCRGVTVYNGSRKGTSRMNSPAT